LLLYLSCKVLDFRFVFYAVIPSQQTFSREVGYNNQCCVKKEGYCTSGRAACCDGFYSLFYYFI
jgi:hypothetical protein